MRQQLPRRPQGPPSWNFSSRSPAHGSLFQTPLHDALCFRGTEREAQGVCGLWGAHEIGGRRCGVWRMFTKRGGGGFGPRTRVGPVWAQAAGPRAGVGTRRPRLPSWWCRGGGPLCRSTARLMQPQEPSGRSRGPGGARSPGSDCRPCAQQSGEGGATRPGGGPAPSGGVLCTERARVALPWGQGAGSGHGHVRRGRGSCDRPHPHPELPRPSDTWPGRRLVPLSLRPLGALCSRSAVERRRGTAELSQ